MGGAEEHESARALVAEADRLLKVGNASGAERVLREGASTWPDDPEIKLMLGWLLRARERDAAVALLRRAAELAPGDPSIAIRCADVLFEAGEPELASSLFRRTLGLLEDPEGFTDGAALASVGAQVWLAAGDDATAERILQEAVAAHPGGRGYPLVLARLYERQNRCDEALKVLDDAIADPMDARYVPEWRVVRRDMLLRRFAREGVT